MRKNYRDWLAESDYYGKEAIEVRLESNPYTYTGEEVLQAILDYYGHGMTVDMFKRLAKKYLEEEKA